MSRLSRKRISMKGGARGMSSKLRREKDKIRQRTEYGRIMRTTIEGKISRGEKLNDEELEFAKSHMPNLILHSQPSTASASLPPPPKYPVSATSATSAMNLNSNNYPFLKELNNNFFKMSNLSIPVSATTATSTSAKSATSDLPQINLGFSNNNNNGSHPPGPATPYNPVSATSASLAHHPHFPGSATSFNPVSATSASSAHHPHFTVQEKENFLTNLSVIFKDHGFTRKHLPLTALSTGFGSKKVWEFRRFLLKTRNGGETASYTPFPNDVCASCGNTTNNRRSILLLGSGMVLHYNCIGRITSRKALGIVLDGSANRLFPYLEKKQHNDYYELEIKELDKSMFLQTPPKKQSKSRKKNLKNN